MDYDPANSGFFDSPMGQALGMFLMVLAYLVLVIVPLLCLLYVLYFLLTMPMRRNERARLFLDLLEMGMNDGRTAERAVVEASNSRDKELGARFHLLAAALSAGMRLSDALAKLPSLLPPRVTGMLRAGDRTGDLRKVLPACRRMLQDGISQTRGALNYVILLIFAMSPALVLIPLFLRIKVLPTFVALSEGQMLPAFTRLVFGVGSLSRLIQFGLLGLLWLLLLAYVGGPRLHLWLQKVWPGLVDGILWRLSWRRQRLLRDFSGIFAALLDSAVPEREAVLLAGEAMDSFVLKRRAAKIAEALAGGTSLPEAIRLVDEKGEFQWRVRNALRGSGGFARALAGWQEALDAKAFQNEQAAAQVTTAVLVLLNGAVVASFVIAIFLVLMQLLNGALLW